MYTRPTRCPVSSRYSCLVRPLVYRGAATVSVTDYSLFLPFPFLSIFKFRRLFVVSHCSHRPCLPSLTFPPHVTHSYFWLTNVHPPGTHDSFFICRNVAFSIQKPTSSGNNGLDGIRARDVCILMV